MLPVEQTSRAVPRWRSIRSVRVLAIVTIAFAPITSEFAEAANAFWLARREAHVARELVAYRAHRPAQIDDVLPDGARGTHFVLTIPRGAGLALPRRSELFVSIAQRTVTEIASIEIHERAHLLQLHASPSANRILRAIGAPSPEEYAATSDDEHFAEMAASAWDLLRPLGELCWASTASERLEEAEQRVPGTAGFVAYFARRPGITAANEVDAVVRLADALIAPLRQDWEVIWAQLEAQRLPNGKLAPWRTLSRLEVNTYAMERARHDSRVQGTLTRILYWPTVMLLRLFDRN